MKTVLKSIPALLLAVVLLLSVGTAAFADGGAVLFDKQAGVTPVILLAKDATDAEKDAADFLQRYLTEAFGTEPAIKTEAQGAAIALTLTEADENVKKGSCKVFMDGDALRIEAADARGLKNGVFEFLYELCGVRVYSADVKVIPVTERLEIPANYTHTYVPTLEYADTDWISPHDRDFSLANGLNGTYSTLETVDGGKVNYIWFCHSLSNGIVPQGELFETHPEYFALTEKGEREPTQLCLSNPDVLARAIEDVRNNLKASYNPDAALNIVSVTQNDNQRYCLCSECTKIADQYGGQSGLMLWFVNQIADAVGPDYPDVVFDTFAYQYTRSAPVGITPRENVCVRLCSIECCFNHTLDDPNCEINVAFMKDLQDWAKISNRLYIWDYVTNFLNTLGVFPNWAVLRQNINVFRENSVVGIYEEGNYYAANCNTEFADLRAWLLARNLRNEYTEEEHAALQKEFLLAYYGEGGEEVGEILDYLTAHAGNSEGHLQIYFSMQDTLHDVTKEDIKRIDDLWDSALQKTKDAGNTAAYDRIARSRLSWDYYEACTYQGRFSLLFGVIPRLSRNAAFIRALKDTGTTQFCEGNMMEGLNVRAYLSPTEWRNGADNEDGVLIAAAVTVQLALAVAVIAVIKKKRLVAVLLPVLALCCAYFGTWASRLFVIWNDLFYYAIIDVCLLLSIAGFGFLAAYAVNGFKPHKGKRAVIVTLIVLAVAVAPYEVGVLLINTIIFHSQRPTYSIALSALIPVAIIVVDLIILAVKLKKAPRPGKPAEAQTDTDPE